MKGNALGQKKKKAEWRDRVRGGERDSGATGSQRLVMPAQNSICTFFNGDTARNVLISRTTRYKPE